MSGPGSLPGHDNGIEALGAYIFAGGFTLGVAKSFKVLAHFEENDYGVKTARHNFPGLPIFVGPDKWPVEDRRYHSLPWVYGNPPCAAWSVAGYTKTRGTDKWKTDPRVECTVKHFNLMRKLRPAVWTWESVTQAWSKGREFVLNLAKDAAAEGYSTTILLHDAQHLGLPQSRKRMFMMCHKVGFAPQAPNWQPPPVPLDFLPFEPTGEAMVEKPDYFTTKRLAKVKPGERLVRYWERVHPDESKWKRNAQGGVVGRPAFGHCRLPVDGVSGATVGYCIVHPTQDRFLSTEEIQLLSGFPPSYRFTPNGKNARAAEIARGVCPTVGEWLARSVKASVEAGRPIDKPEVVEVDFRRQPSGSDDTQRRVVSLDETAPEPQALKSAGKVHQVKLPKLAVQLVMTDVLRMPKPKEGLGSGVYIKLLLDMERFTTPEIVAAVKQHYPKSKATGADVSYHRDEMRKGGRMVGVVRQTLAGRKLVPYEKKEKADAAA